MVRLQQLGDGHHANFRFSSMLAEVGEMLSAEYGQLCQPFYEAARTSDDDVIQHFFCCDHLMALDFIEACFYAFENPGQIGVDTINRIFEDTGVGYWLTNCAQPTAGSQQMPDARIPGDPSIQRPQIIKKDSQFSHAEIVQPALAVLSDKRYKGANEEFLKAHEHYRHGDHKACLNECLKAFESTMKIICEAKHWTPGPNSTAHPLIRTCVENGLLASFTETQMISVRTSLESGVPPMRNKRAAHGQGSEPYEVPPELARYALNLTATTILLLTDCAKL
jgi:hypothetical protein